MTGMFVKGAWIETKNEPLSMIDYRGLMCEVYRVQSLLMMRSNQKVQCILAHYNDYSVLFQALGEMRRDLTMFHYRASGGMKGNRNKSMVILGIPVEFCGDGVVEPGTIVVCSPIDKYLRGCVDNYMMVTQTISGIVIPLKQFYT
ncbi:hypothetical protein [Bacteroides sp.]|uniref:hypothetical protein n=1 Tax=Bacteroides sp. TaxID=29523 RepID=UPI00261BA3BA|nr:hypothetical protein [Bacteroides sp.]MDD3039031.1 hypothetical protein [Bacteroides sp.]